MSTCCWSSNETTKTETGTLFTGCGTKRGCRQNTCMHTACNGNLNIRIYECIMSKIKQMKWLNVFCLPTSRPRVKEGNVNVIFQFCWLMGVCCCACVDNRQSKTQFDMQKEHCVRIKRFGFRHHQVAKPTCCIKRCGKYLGVGFQRHGNVGTAPVAVMVREWLEHVNGFVVECDCNDFRYWPSIQEKQQIFVGRSVRNAPANTCCMHLPWKLRTSH